MSLKFILGIEDFSNIFDIEKKIFSDLCHFLSISAKKTMAVDVLTACIDKESDKRSKLKQSVFSFSENALKRREET